MIKLLNSSNETLAVLENVVNPIISEEINREFSFNFATVIDNDKSNYVNYQHKVEVEDNYFNIVYTEEEREQDGVYINAQCEHVSYDLISASLTAGFTATGLFSAVATTLLAGTGFTVGTVQITASQTISVNESTNKRQVLMQLASLYGGELKFSKYAISLLTRRGADRGVQFRYRKNLVGVKRITDNRKKVGGLPTISYSVSAAELEFEQGFITAGTSSLEHYELGDTVKVIDSDLNLNTALRIVKESHDVNQRMQGQVQISNFVDDLADTLTTIQTTSVSKNNVYNGCSIGPDNGFVAEKSDGKAKTIMNATEGISIYSDVGLGLVRNFFVDTDGRIKAKQIDISGSGTFGGTITIGTGSNTFKVDATNGMWLGATAFATAPFSVTLSGAATATGITVISGSITGAVVQTATTGRRIVLSGSELQSLNSDTKDGFTLDGVDGFLRWYNISGVNTGLIGIDTSQPYEQLYFSHAYLYLYGSSAINLGSPTINIGEVGGTVNVANVLNAASLHATNGSNGSFSTTGSYTITVTDGIITGIV